MERQRSKKWRRSKLSKSKSTPHIQDDENSQGATKSLAQGILSLAQLPGIRQRSLSNDVNSDAQVNSTAARRPINIKIQVGVEFAAIGLEHNMPRTVWEMKKEQENIKVKTKCRKLFSVDCQGSPSSESLDSGHHQRSHKSQLRGSFRKQLREALRFPSNRRSEQKYYYAGGSNDSSASNSPVTPSTSEPSYDQRFSHPCDPRPSIDDIDFDAPSAMSRLSLDDGRKPPILRSSSDLLHIRSPYHETAKGDKLNKSSGAVELPPIARDTRMQQKRQVSAKLARYSQRTSPL